MCFFSPVKIKPESNISLKRVWDGVHCILKVLWRKEKFITSHTINIKLIFVLYLRHFQNYQQWDKMLKVKTLWLGSDQEGQSCDFRALTWIISVLSPLHVKGCFYFFLVIFIVLLTQTNPRYSGVTVRRRRCSALVELCYCIHSVPAITLYTLEALVVLCQVCTEFNEDTRGARVWARELQMWMMMTTTTMMMMLYVVHFKSLLYLALHFTKKQT